MRWLCSHSCALTDEYSALRVDLLLMLDVGPTRTDCYCNEFSFVDETSTRVMLHTSNG